MLADVCKTSNASESTVSIRYARKEDIHEIINLCKLHAEHECSEYDANGKAELLTSAMFCEDQQLFCIVAVADHRLVGYATYLIQYATWSASHYLYMDCLYLIENIRGYGVGEKMMNIIRNEAIRLGYNEVQWQTPETNENAIKFYERIGAYRKRKERFFWEMI